MENVPLAGFYLLHSIRRAGADGEPEIRFLTREEELLDDRHILGIILEWQPQIICCTLYLWNIERSLHILRLARRSTPLARIVVGGPEVSFHHPFLLRSLVPDVVVVGEGEGVFPDILRALRKGAGTDFALVGWKKGRRYEWGRRPVPEIALEESLPPADDPGWMPDANGSAYLEAGRGCPMSCTYCRYPHLRRRMSFLSPAEVVKRVRVLRDRGAREIRFVDPTLNANPQFTLILQALDALNRSSGLKFFAELRAESLNPRQIELLARAGFKEIEVGVQSRDPRVLRLVGRTANQAPLEENLRRMISEGIHVTLDLMYGLPEQRFSDVSDSLRWAQDLGPEYVQCLQTLLIPGTQLRRERKKWGIQAGSLPPYGVRSTNSLTWKEILRIEELIHEISSTDCMTCRFVGYRLPDLFEEKVVIDLDRDAACTGFSGSSSRRAVLFRGYHLFEARSVILRVLRESIRAEPHTLWQFILQPPDEVPLDLLEEMIAGVREFRSQWMDRFASVAGWDRISSRRIFVLLRRGHPYSRTWIQAVQSLLADHFY